MNFFFDILYITAKVIINIMVHSDVSSSGNVTEQTLKTNGNVRGITVYRIQLKVKCYIKDLIAGGRQSIDMYLFSALILCRNRNC
jgi:hypothetical protein